MTPSTMLAARLHGPRDLRVEPVARPTTPGPGQVLLRVAATGICGSDLHTYKAACIGDTILEAPLILGHEFAGVIEETGPEAVDGRFQPLRAGLRVAVDPGQPCGHCDLCVRGHPNLCRRLHFCGLYPDDGSLCQWMLVPARTCFPVPDSIDPAAAAMLEPLGIALHAVDLARLRVADSLAILGAGPIGLCILQIARLAGAGPIFVTDKFPWRLDLAKQFGGVPINCDTQDPVEAVSAATKGCGVDAAIEAAWGDQSVQQAGEMLRLGGRLVLVGIPDADRLEIKPSTFRRKGLTLRLCRRMQHTYPRAIQLAAHKTVDLGLLISHRFPLERTAEAFALNAAYQDQVLKIIIES